SFSSATVTIDVPPVPTVSISGGGSISEGWGSTDLTVTRTGPTTSDLPVALRVGGTADEGQDYFTLPDYVVIPAGSSSVQLPLVAIDQGLASGSVEADIALQAPDVWATQVDYQLGSANTASVTINDDDELATNGGPLATPTLDVSETGALALTDPTASTNQGTLVSSLLGGASGGSAAADADGDALGIAVTAVDSAFGNWQYSLDGTNWFALAPVPAANGDQQAELLPADGTTRLRFLADPGYSGTMDDAITFLAWDQAVGAPGTLFDVSTGSAAAAFSAASAQVSLAVYGPNDTPGVSIGGPGTIAAGDAATFTVTLAHASDQTVSVNWMPQDGTAVHPDDWTQGTFTPGYEVTNYEDGYEVNAVATGTLEDGYYYEPYSVDTGYTVDGYDYNAYSYDSGYWQPGYQYNSYDVDTGYWQDGYDYAPYTTDGQVLTDGYYYQPYSIPNYTTVSGFTVTDLWEDQPYQDDSGDWIDNYVDVPVTPYFVATGTPDTINWAQYYPDSQQVPDGTYDTGDGYWEADATPDTSWPGGYVAQQQYVDGTITVPGTWAAGPQDPSWPGGSSEDPHWVDTGTVTVPGTWASDASPDPSWGGTYTYAPEWMDTGMVNVPAGWEATDTPDPNWTAGYTYDPQWFDTGTVDYDGYWEPDASPDLAWPGGYVAQQQWVGDGGASPDVPFWSEGDTIDPSWTDYEFDPIVTSQYWVPDSWELGGTLTFAPGQTSETISVQTFDDGLGGSKYFDVALSDASGATLESPTSGVATIVESDADYQPPTAGDVSGAADYGVPVTIALLADSSDPQGLPLSIDSVSGASYGSVTYNDDGTATYTPNAGFSGGDSFTFTIDDGQHTAVGTAYVTVGQSTTTGGSDDLSAAVESNSGDQDTSITGNVSDGVAGGLGGYTFSGAGASYGSVTVNSDGSYTYTPNPGYFGPDSFTYTVTDRGGATTGNTVDLTINQAAPQDDLAAAADSNGGDQDTTIYGSVAGDASGGIGGYTFSGGGGADGSVTVNSDGSYTYTPNGGYSGPDSFSYTVTDSTGITATNTVNLWIAQTTDDGGGDDGGDGGPQGMPPVAGAVSASATVGSTITINLLGNSSDPQGFALTVDSVGQGSLGNVNNNGDGTVTYTPTATGTDSFNFTIDDGQNTASGTVVVTVSAAPLSGTDLNVACTQNGSLGGSAMPAISGGVGTVSFQPVNGATGGGGSVTMDSTGAFSYTPVAGFTGTDSFAYSAIDGAGETAAGTVYIAVS
ncbi:MAG TPA: tandem-95 repeat protein, partial [Pirellulales bacterium]